jgi:FMN-dependent NADH-azoreductase
MPAKQRTKERSMIILHVDSSINGEKSVSRLVSRSVVDQLMARNPDAEIVRRDLATEPLAHLQLDALAESAVVDEFLAADVIVVGAPMYNFAIPSQLKAWIDRIAVAGKTFSYTAKGPVGLAGGRKLIIASSRGGVFGPETPFASLDNQETYLRVLFGFLGITDIIFVRAEGVGLGPEARERAIAAAQREVRRLAA